MKEFTYKEKIAIVKVLTEILQADNVVHDNEIEYMNEVVESFNLDSNYQSDLDKMMTIQALSIIRDFSVAQKEKVSKMMGTMIVVDRDINYNEVKLYNTFCETCDISKDFNVNDYPEISLSGPFINPEDI